MVDALRRAHRMVTPDGAIIDVHPTAAPACVEVGGERIGPLEAGDAVLRHGAADKAIATAVGAGLVDAAAAVDFVYYTYGDTIEELRDHIAANWRSTRISDGTVARTLRVLEWTSGPVRPRVVEHVRLTSLRIRSRRPGEWSA